MGGPDPPIFKKMVHEERGGKGLAIDAKACSCEIQLSYKFDWICEYSARAWFQ